MDEAKKTVSSNLLNGQAFVLTGALKNYTREKAGQLIMDRGGRVSSSVSKKTQGVIVGESPGSKLEEARRLGVKILSEEDFKKLLEANQ